MLQLRGVLILPHFPPFLLINIVFSLSCAVGVANRAVKSYIMQKRIALSRYAIIKDI
jgi:hypothetical protein